MGEYTGTIVCDALATPAAGARAGGGSTLAACWAHAFRRFEEAQPDHPEAEKALAWIGALYELDRQAEGDLARLAELRRTESAAVLAELKAWLREQASLTSLAIGKATASPWLTGSASRASSRTRGSLSTTTPPSARFAPGRRAEEPLRLNVSDVAPRSPRRSTPVLETLKLHGKDPAAYLHAAILAADHGGVLLPRQFDAAA